MSKLIAQSDCDEMIVEMEAKLHLAHAQKDAAYQERDKCVALICHFAILNGVTAGLGVHKGENWDEEWRNIVFIDLPSGQVSWHIHNSELPLFSFLPSYEGEWDGHTSFEKYERTACPDLMSLPMHPVWQLLYEQLLIVKKGKKG